MPNKTFKHLADHYACLLNSGVVKQHVVDLIKKHIKGIEDLQPDDVSDTDRSLAISELTN